MTEIYPPLTCYTQGEGAQTLPDSRKKKLSIFKDTVVGYLRNTQQGTKKYYACTNAHIHYTPKYTGEQQAHWKCQCAQNL